MEIKNFFLFSSKFSLSSVQAYPLDENLKYLKLIKGDYSEIKFPIILKQEEGRVLNDILDTGYGGLFLISNRMKFIMEENKLTGWKTFPIKFYDKKKNEIFDYYGFSVTGKSGPTIYDGCEIIEKKRVPDGPICKFYKGVIIDQWDGNDFFTPDGSYETIITKKAADVLKKSKITNMLLQNLATKEINVNNIKK